MRKLRKSMPFRILLRIPAALGFLAGLSLVVTTVMAQQPPPNDPFTNATVISGISGSISGSNINATADAGETLWTTLSGVPGGSSVWYTWTAPVSGTFTFSTAGSDFDTLLGVYTGNSVARLTPIIENDDV